MIEVKYKNKVIGHTPDEGKTIIFLDNDESKEFQKVALKGYPIGLSSRSMGIVHEKGIVAKGPTNELSFFETDTQ